MKVLTFDLSPTGSQMDFLYAVWLSRPKVNEYMNEDNVQDVLTFEILFMLCL